MLPNSRIFALVFACAFFIAPVQRAFAQESGHGQQSQLLERIDNLKKKGAGVEPYLKLIQQCRDDEQRGASQAAEEKYARLAASIESQEKLLSSRSSLRLRTGISRVVAYLPPPPQLAPTPAEHAVTAAVSSASNHNQQADKQPDAFVLMNQVLGMKSINDLTGPERTAGDRLLMTIAEKALGADCPDTEGPFLLERVRIALRIQELEHRKLSAESYREYNRDKIEALVRTHNPRYARQIADNIQYLERQIGVKELDRAPITR